MKSQHEEAKKLAQSAVTNIRELLQLDDDQEVWDLLEENLDGFVQFAKIVSDEEIETFGKGMSFYGLVHGLAWGLGIEIKELNDNKTKE